MNSLAQTTHGAKKDMSIIAILNTYCASSFI